MALNFLTVEANCAKLTLREIIRQEYPRDRGVDLPSHREDLMADLIQIGVKHSEIKKTEPTKKTVTTIREAFESIITFSHNEKFSDIMLLAFLRYWGEVLTALEYELLWPRIEKLLDGKKSVFYEYHIEHDKDSDGLDAIAKTHEKGFTHADNLGRELAEVIAITQRKYQATEDKNAAINSAIEAIKYSTQNKIDFYHQFIQG
jgi:ribosomal protein L17